MSDSPDTPVEVRTGTPKTKRLLVFALAGALLLGAVGWGVWRSPIFDEQRYRTQALGISYKYKVWFELISASTSLGDLESASDADLEMIDYTKQLPDVWRSMTPPDKYAFIHSRVQEGLDSMHLGTSAFSDEVFMETVTHLKAYAEEMDLVDSTEALGD